jgi:menaquinone-dependent protoporphyrinogen oxidase
MQFKVLVAYSSKHGSTREIAQRIGGRLRAGGLIPDVRDIGAVSDVSPYDAVVLGSAVYMGAWRREATEFARKHSTELAARPVWLFSSGPLGEPSLEEPRHLAELRAALKPRGHTVFTGALDSSKLSLPERIVISAVAGQVNHALEGDFRDWKEIDTWAGSIAEALGKMPVAAEVR